MQEATLTLFNRTNGVVQFALARLAFTDWPTDLPIRLFGWIVRFFFIDFVVVLVVVVVVVYEEVPTNTNTHTQIQSNI